MSGLLSFNGEFLKHTQPAKNNSGVILYIQNRCVYVETHYYFIKSECNNGTHCVEGELQKVQTTEWAY